MGPPDDPATGRILLGIARAAIASEFGQRLPYDSVAPWLAEPGAVFVTLTRGGELRGCIGSVTPRRGLAADVWANARAAAFRDRRFTPLTADQFPDVEIEVSLLSPTERLTFTSEADAVAQLRPGVDGVVLAWHSHRATFLPQVWEQLPRPVDFLARLKRKADLPAGFWQADVQLRRFTVTAWKESELRLASP